MLTVTNEELQKYLNLPKPDPIDKDMAKEIRFIVVDDDAQVVDVLQNFLEDIGFSADIALNAHEAISLFEKNQYQMVISDIRMPGGMSGVELAVKLLKDGFEGGIILMTGYYGQYSEENILTLGVDAYIEKPFSIDLLEKLIYAILEKKNLING